MQLYKYRYLILELIKIEITQNYKRSFIGLSWLLFLPLLQSLVWIFLQMNGLLDPGDIGVNYIPYVLIGTCLWQLYNQSYDLLGNSISTSIKPLTQGNIPVYCVVIARFALVFIRFMISFFVNISLLKLFIDVELDILHFLLYIIPLIFFCMSVGMIISMIEVVNEDIYLVGKEFNKILLFLTPIIYSPKVEMNVIHKIIELNPLTYLICVPRSLLFKIDTVSMDTFYSYSIAVMIFFSFCLLIYLKRARILIEKLIE